MNEKQLGVCIVGCGFMGTIHAEGWQRHPLTQVVAVVDVNPERAAVLAERLGAVPFTDYREAIRLPQVDAVSVCIPTCLHAEVAVAAMELGKHVLCEKPIALTIADAERMAAAARGSRTQLGIGFMRRHSPVVAELKRFLDAGHLGRPVLYQATDFRELRPKRLMHAADGNGGPVIDMAVHLFDLWSNLFDSRPVQVFAQGLTLAAGRAEIAHIANQAIDTASIVVRYASGDVGTFQVSWGLPPGANPLAWPDRIFGPRGMVEAEYHRAHQCAHWLKEGGAWETIAECRDDMYFRQIDSFARCLTEGQALAATPEHGRQALQVALAALESIGNGTAISLV